MNIEACFIVEFRKHPSLFTSCVIIIWIFRQTLQFGVDIRFINRQFFFSLSQPFIRVVIATVLVSLFLRKVEWKSFSFFFFFFEKIIYLIVNQEFYFSFLTLNY